MIGVVNVDAWPRMPCALPSRSCRSSVSTKSRNASAAPALSRHADVVDEEVHQRVHIAHIQRDSVFGRQLTNLIECL